MKQKCFSTRAFPKCSRLAQTLLLGTLVHKPKYIHTLFFSANTFIHAQPRLKLPPTSEEYNCSCAQLVAGWRLLHYAQKYIWVIESFTQ